MNLEQRVALVKEHFLLSEIISETTPLRQVGQSFCGDESHGGHSSLVVQDDKQRWFWNSKGENGDVIEWVRQYVLGGSRFYEALVYLERRMGGYVESNSKLASRPVAAPKPPLPVDVAVAYHQALLNNVTALRWWYARGLVQETIERFLLGYKQNHMGLGPTSSIPLMESGELLTIRHRLWNATGEQPRYLPEQKGYGSHLFNSDLLFDEPEEVLVVEGEIKTMVVEQAGHKAVGISGCNVMPSRYIEPLSKIPNVYVCFDPVLNSRIPVTPYDIGWLATLVMLGKNNVFLVGLPEKVDDMIVRYDWGAEALKRAISGAKRVTQAEVQKAKETRQKRLSGAF